MNALEKEKYQDLEDRFIKVTKELNEWKAAIVRSSEGPIDPGPWRTGNSVNENYRSLDRTQMTVCPPGELRQALQAFRGMTGTERDDVRSYLIRGMNGLKEEQRERFNRTR